MCVIVIIVYIPFHPGRFFKQVLLAQQQDRKNAELEAGGGATHEKGEDPVPTLSRNVRDWTHPV